MDKLQDRIGHTFKNANLLETAMTHSSYANENRQHRGGSNERLEFLGDSVLGLVVSEYLYMRHPRMAEGELSRLRAALVCEGSLSEVAREIGLGGYLKLGRGESNTGGRDRPSILADAVEAVIGAVFLDGGFECARSFVRRFLLGGTETVFRDYKTELQELVQRDRQGTLFYRMTGETGPDHAKRFFTEVLINGEPSGYGEGESKKAAEQAAACDALERINGEKD